LFFLFFIICYCAEKWSPALQIRTVLLSIQALLSAPNPDDPLANDVAEKWKANESAAISTGWLFVCASQHVGMQACMHCVYICSTVNLVLCSMDHHTKM